MADQQYLEGRIKEFEEEAERDPYFALATLYKPLRNRLKIAYATGQQALASLLERVESLATKAQRSIESGLS